MEFTDFCSPAYKLETVAAECSRMVNFYLERIEQGPRAGKLRMRPTPGLRQFSSVPTPPVRGMLRIDGGNRLFVMGGDILYEVFRDGSNRPLAGGVAASDRPVTMAANRFQIAIASGGYGYIAENTPAFPNGVVRQLAYSTDGTPVRAATIDFFKQFFIAALLDSPVVTSSRAAPNGSTWDGESAAKELFPDNISRVFALNDQLYLYGFDSYEPWVGNSAVGGFPFVTQGICRQNGLTAPYSLASAAGVRFWLWGNAVYEAFGTEAERISDFGVEEAIKTYGDISSAEGWAYMDGGHVFYVLSFPSADRTWVYDRSTKAWHERLYFLNGKYSRFRGRCYAHAFGKHLVGDYQTGQIFEMSQNFYSDDAQFTRRQRTCPYITFENRNLRYNQLTIDMDTGTGPASQSHNEFGNPQINLRYSDDRGKTWGNELQEGVGFAGETKERVIFNQLGSSRIGKVFEIVVTDAIPWAFNTAYLDVGPSAARSRERRERG